MYVLYNLGYVKFYTQYKSFLNLNNDLLITIILSLLNVNFKDLMFEAYDNVFF